MAPRKSSCFSLLRLASLIVLLFFLIIYAYFIVASFSIEENQAEIEFSKDHGYILHIRKYIPFVGGPICLAAILFFFIKTPAKYLLNIVVVLLFLHLIHYICVGLLLGYTGKTEIKNYPESYEFLAKMIKWEPSYTLKIISALINVIIVSISIWILLRYVAELKKPHFNEIRGDIDVGNIEARFSTASPDNVQFTVPRHFNQQSQNPVRATSAPQWIQPKPNRSTYPTLPQMV